MTICRAQKPDKSHGLMLNVVEFFGLASLVLSVFFRSMCFLHEM